MEMPEQRTAASLPDRLMIFQRTRMPFREAPMTIRKVGPAATNCLAAPPQIRIQREFSTELVRPAPDDGIARRSTGMSHIGIAGPVRQK